MHLVLPFLLVACGNQDSAKPADSNPVGNTAPTADAGVNTSGSTDAAISLSGTGSTDPDGDAITYHWTFAAVPEGSALATRTAPFTRNHSADASSTAFTADLSGVYTVQLVVNDGHLDSAPDQVVVTVVAGEQIPVANAGSDLTVTAGSSATLDGSKSYDPLARELSYSWSLVDKPTDSTAALTDATTVSPKLSTDKKGAYVVNLVVSNGVSNSIADAVTVTATGTEGAPTANAGPDQLAAQDCTTINLDCSASSDPDGDGLTYQWEVQSKPAGSAVNNASFSDRTAAKPSFWADVAGSYTLSCAAFDGTAWSSPDLMSIQAAERSTNARPVVDAGTAQNIAGGNAECSESGYSYNCKECAEQTITLGADATMTDPDGDPVTYSWTLLRSDSTAVIANAGSLVTTVELSDVEPVEPGACNDVEFEFQLEVTDCTGEKASDTVTVTVSCCGTEDT